VPGGYFGLAAFLPGGLPVVLAGAAPSRVFWALLGSSAGSSGGSSLVSKSKWH
jgi:hypothetical protein